MQELLRALYKSLATKQQFIDAKVDMISLDTALSGYYVVQGRTLTNTAGKDRINIVRVNDTIRKDLYFNLQAYKGENNSRKVRNMIASSISAYMSSMARSGYIVSYSQPVIDESNNSTTDYYNGNLNINLSYTPLYPIDRIEITLTRDVSGTVTLA
jgi:phage tail sheath protein FI